MAKKLSTKEIVTRIELVHAGLVILDISTYKNTRTKARFVDKEFGEWYTKPIIVLNGSGHPKRKYRGLSTKFRGSKSLLNKIHELYGDQLILDKSTYVNLNVKCRFVHKVYGEWWAFPKNILKGVDHPLLSREKASQRMTLTNEQIDTKIKLIHGSIITIDYSTHNGSTEKSRFIDVEFGEFWAFLGNVFKGKGHPGRGRLKRKATCLEKYGVDHPSKVKEIALKICKKLSKTTMRVHWESGEELICQGGWEPKVVDYLNNNKIKFEWQPKVFEMPNGHTYRPDLFLINENKWVEIKGYFRKDAKEKWDWFQTIMPNSALWQETDLKKMGIL